MLNFKKENHTTIILYAPFIWPNAPLNVPAKAEWAGGPCGAPILETESSVPGKMILKNARAKLALCKARGVAEHFRTMPGCRCDGAFSPDFFQPLIVFSERFGSSLYRRVRRALGVSWRINTSVEATGNDSNRSPTKSFAGDRGINRPESKDVIGFDIGGKS